MNTLEQLVVFLPALWIFASYISPLWAAALGVGLHHRPRDLCDAPMSRDPKSRSLGLRADRAAEPAMLLGILIWAVWALVEVAGAS